MAPEQVRNAIIFVKSQDLKILFPQIVSEKHHNSIYGSAFFEYDEDKKIKSSEWKVIACDPLGAVIYNNTPSPVKGNLSASCSFAFLAKILGADYDWARGFTVGWQQGLIGEYKPKHRLPSGELFDLRKNFNEEAFDFGFQLYEELKGG